MSSDLQVVDKTKQLEGKIQEMLKKEKEIQEKFGFSAHAVEGMAFTKALKVKGEPTMIAAFAHPAFYEPQKLAEIVALVAAAAQQDGTVKTSYALPFGIPTSEGEQALANRVVKLDRLEFIAHVDIYGLGIYPDPGTKCYIVKIGDILNTLPGDENYLDFGQEGRTLDMNALKERWSDTGYQDRLQSASKFNLREALGLPSIPAAPETDRG